MVWRNRESRRIKWEYPICAIICGICVSTLIVSNQSYVVSVGDAAGSNISDVKLQDKVIVLEVTAEEDIDEVSGVEIREMSTDMLQVNGASSVESYLSASEITQVTSGSIRPPMEIKLNILPLSYESGKNRISYMQLTADDKQMVIKSANAEFRGPIVNYYEFSSKDIEMINSVVMHEVGWCSKKSMKMVAHTIFNRLSDPNFPNSIYEILHSPGQYEAVVNYYDNRIAVTDEVRLMVQEAMNESDITGGAVYYCNPNYISNKKVLNWFSTLTVTATNDGQIYYR